MNEDLQPLDDESQKSTVLLTDLQQIISGGKFQAVAAVNSALTLTYWHVGKRINEDVLQGERAAYGKQVIRSVAQSLVEQYGKSFEAKNLHRMMQFAEIFTEVEIVVPLVRQLSWSHFLVLIPLKVQEARMFYAEQVELMNLQKDNIMVAEYWTELPPKELLEEKLHTALIEIKTRLSERKIK